MRFFLFIGPNQELPDQVQFWLEENIEPRDYVYSQRRLEEFVHGDKHVGQRDYIRVDVFNNDAAFMFSLRWSSDITRYQEAGEYYIRCGEPDFTHQI